MTIRRRLGTLLLTGTLATATAIGPSVAAHADDWPQQQTQEQDWSGSPYGYYYDGDLLCWYEDTQVWLQVLQQDYDGGPWYVVVDWYFAGSYAQNYCE